MALTYQPIARAILTGGNPEITFSNIPATYTDLKLVIVPISNQNDTNTYMRFNGDTATNYSSNFIYGNGSTIAGAISFNESNGILLDFGGSKTTNLTSMNVDIFSYANTNIRKSVLSVSSADDNGSGQSSIHTGLWRSTSAITSLTLRVLGVTFYVAGTTASLYGILRA